MYLTCTVKISDEDVKQFLQEVAGYEEEELEDKITIYSGDVCRNAKIL